MPQPSRDLFVIWWCGWVLLSTSWRTACFSLLCQHLSSRNISRQKDWTKRQCWIHTVSAIFDAFDFFLLIHFKYNVYSNRREKCVRFRIGNLLRWDTWVDASDLNAFFRRLNWVSFKQEDQILTFQNISVNLFFNPLRPDRRCTGGREKRHKVQIPIEQWKRKMT